jgi:putative membrane protein
MTGFILRALIAALGLWLATEWVDGVTIDSAGTLIIAGLLLGIVNAIVRPLAVILTFPITLVTLGLFLLIVNAAMVALVAWFLPGFNLAGFWPASSGLHSGPLSSSVSRAGSGHGSLAPRARSKW